MSTSTGTSLSPTAGQLLKRVRGVLLAVTVLAVTGVALAALQSDGHHRPLDPRSTDPTGSRATAQLLAQHGVHTRVVTSAQEAAAAAGPDTTVLVADPDAVRKKQQQELRKASERGGRTMLLGSGPSSTPTLAPGVRATAPVQVQQTPPDCELRQATRAGDASLGGYRYTRTGNSDRTEQSDGCYLRKGLPTVLRTPATASAQGVSAERGDTLLVGAPDLLYNKQLDKHGNASLALQLLGSRQNLVWYLPSPAESTGGDNDSSFFSLLPSGWYWGTVQLSVAALLAAVWRARRLGRLVPEQLPVSVPASETTEGRARLYRRAAARDRAAEALRSATRSRLAPLIGVARSQAHEPESLVPAITMHTAPETSTGDTSTPHTAPHVRSLLFGDAPSNDTALIQLADALDQLERSITGTAPGAPSTPEDKDRTT